MIVDASAVLAIFFAAPGSGELSRLIAGSRGGQISVANWLECAIRLDNAVPGAAQDLDDFLGEAGIEVVPVTPAQGRIARLAHRHYGKGRHKAALNFGDCLAYALARETGEPLLCTGNDFARTDLRLAG
jgi:ribonuclease VapC